MLNLEKIKIAIVGIGNCASSLIQGIHYYDGKNPEDAIGLMHWEIGGYKPSDIDVVAAFDVDARKVGKTIDEAITEYKKANKIGDIKIFADLFANIIIKEEST